VKCFPVLVTKHCDSFKTAASTVVDVIEKSQLRQLSLEDAIEGSQSDNFFVVHIPSHTIQSFYFSFPPIWGVSNGMKLNNKTPKQWNGVFVPFRSVPLHSILFRSIPLRSIPSIQTLYFTIFPLKIPHLIKLTCFGSLRTTNYQFNMNVVENRFIKCQLKSNWLKELMLNNIQIRGPINLISQSFG
jgi:hypothetical protein